LAQNKYVAALDIGSNSFHLVIAKVYDDGTFKIVDRERDILRLASEEGNGFSFINESKFEKAADIIGEYKTLADTYNAHFRAIATSAVREASNRMEFLLEVKNKTGVEIEIIDGIYEANLIYKGISGSLPILDKKALCFDIGGGSTEILIGKKGETLFAESLKLGAVRLSQLFFPDYIISEDRIEKCKQYINERLGTVKQQVLNVGFELAAGTSGSFRTVVSVIKRTNLDDSKHFNGSEFTYNEFLKITNLILRNKTVEDRLKIEGLEAKRADIIPSGVLILNSIFETFGIEKFVYSDYALREGVLIDTINKLSTL
jgi:exopolyphosphatase/guanosine-5'-triphosphate,3'-diphosphate pyrophosphatase